MVVNQYSINRLEKLKLDEEKENYIFGICIGFLLIFANLLVFFKSGESIYIGSIYFSKEIVSIINIVNISLIILGGLMILSVVISPSIITPISKLFRCIFLNIADIFLKLILTLIYFFIIFPIGMIVKIKDRKIYENESTNFSLYEKSDVVPNSKIFGILSIFRAFFNEKYILILPVIILLVIIGILLFFVQSTMLTPFIYALF